MILSDKENRGTECICGGELQQRGAGICMTYIEECEDDSYS